MRWALRRRRRVDGGGIEEGLGEAGVGDAVEFVESVDKEEWDW